MTSQRQLRLVISLFFVLAALVPAFAQEAPLTGFDDYVNKALREWEVPRANRFNIEGAPSGFFIQFEMTEGKVKSLALVQGARPSLVLLAKQ